MLFVILFRIFFYDDPQVSAIQASFVIYIFDANEHKRFAV